jgi:hypothetical protein
MRVNMARDSWASAVDIGTGDDFRSAAATSEAGRARRLRAESLTFAVDGPEKSLLSEIKRENNRKTETYIQTLSNAPQLTKQHTVPHFSLT